jgi:protein-disulfide isomerase
VSGTGNSPRRRSSKGKPRIVRPDGTTDSRSTARAQAAAAREQAARRAQIIRFVAGAAAIAAIAAIVLIGFNVLGGDDNDASDDAVVIPTTAAPDAAAGADASPDAAASPSSDASANETPDASSDTSTGTVHALGAADAPVTVIEWADYQCPFCGEFARDIQPQMIEEYVNSGQVRFEFRDLAFLGDESVQAAEAAWCAGDQDKFWEFHDTLFSNQNGENQGAFADERLVEMASKLGLDMTAFESCFNGKTYESDILALQDDASSQGVNQTPTLFINGEKLVGVENYNEFRDSIETALNS